MKKKYSCVFCYFLNNGRTLNPFFFRLFKSFWLCSQSLLLSLVPSFVLSLMTIYTASKTKKAPFLLRGLLVFKSRMFRCDAPFELISHSFLQILRNSVAFYNIAKLQQSCKLFWSWGSFIVHHSTFIVNSALPISPKAIFPRLRLWHLLFLAARTPPLFYRRALFSLACGRRGCSFDNRFFYFR